MRDMRVRLPVDAFNLNTKALEFACYLGRLTKKITGVFLENLVAKKGLY
ncbi:MAG: hypothetical protein JWP81_3087 [Ferruginibacter sp.]|nr:hypothetical protein [Ferruginibacter sp.]